MLALAHKMAAASGEVLKRYFRSSLSVERKADSSPVTRADREAEAVMRTLIETHFPEHGIIGEEMGEAFTGAAYQWVLDPIDGTRAFLAGYPTFTTLIALVQNGVPILGIIDQPISGERWVGMTGSVTKQGDSPLKVRGADMLGDAVLATTSIDYFTPSQAESFGKLRKNCANCALGGDAYAYAMLASGQVDVVVDAGLKPYDFCALVPVIQGAGGVITDWSGDPVTLDSDGTLIASANAQLHQQALALLK